MSNRFKRNLYTKQDIRYDKSDHRFHYVSLPNGCLYANGKYPTKITEDELPDWYIYGRYYKRFGYMSTKGIVDMIYEPCLWINHFLKDDRLVISYTGKIEKIQDPNSNYITYIYSNEDESVYGNEILDILKGAEMYSGFNISGFVPQLKNKIKVMKENYPEEFKDFNFDVDKWYSEPFKPWRPNPEKRSGVENWL